LVFSSYTFKVLPLIPIDVDGVTPDEAVELVREDPPIDANPIEISDIVDPSKSMNRAAKPVLNGDTLRLVDPGSALVMEWKKTSNVQPQIMLNPQLESIHQCRGCNSLFSDIDFEQTFLEGGACPLCRTPLDLEAENELSEQNESYSDLLRKLREFATNVPIEF